MSPHRKRRNFLFKLFGLVGIEFPEGKLYRVRLNGKFFALIGIGIIGMAIIMVGMFEFSTTPTFCRSCHIMEPYYVAWETSKHKGKATCVQCHYTKEDSIIKQKFQATSQLVKYVTRTYGSRPRAEVGDKNCLQEGCHETRLLEGKIVTARGINFNHTPHLMEVRRGKELQCTSCHSQIMVGTHLEVTYPSCYLCHFKGHKPTREELPLAGCTKCHDAPATPVVLSDGTTQFNHADFINQPNVKCLDCHLDAVAGDGPAPKERCFSCHNTPERIAQYSNTNFIHQNHVADHKIECIACHLEIKHEVGALQVSSARCAECHNHNPGHDAINMLYSGIWPGSKEVKPSGMFKTHVQCIACHTNKESNGKFGQYHFSPDPKSCDNCHGEGFGDYIQQWRSDSEAAIKQIEAKVAKLKPIPATLPEKDPNRIRIERALEHAQRDVDFVKAGKAAHNYDLVMEKLGQTQKLLDEAAAAM